MEEAQHAKLDTLMVQGIAATCSEAEIDAAIDGYLSIGGLLDGGFAQQVELDLESLTTATGRVLTAGEREQFVAVQRQANRWTYLGSGMTHVRFLATVEQISPKGRRRLEEVAPMFC